MTPDSKGWFYILDGNRLGPVFGDTLLEAIREERITAETLVWSKGMGEWHSAKDSALRDLIFGSPPPPPLQTPVAAINPEPSVLDAINFENGKAEVSPIPSTTPSSALAESWHANQLRSWQIQRAVSVVIFVVSCGLYGAGVVATNSSRLDNMMAIAGVMAGTCCLAADRKLRIVRQFRRTGETGIHFRIAIKMLGVLGLLSMAIGITGALFGGKLLFTIITGASFCTISYILSAFSGFNVLRKCAGRAVETNLGSGSGRLQDLAAKRSLPQFLSFAGRVNRTGWLVTNLIIVLCMGCAYDFSDYCFGGGCPSGR